MRHETLKANAAQPVQAADPDGFSQVYSSTRYPESHTLPPGAQARLVRAAAFSAQIGAPVDALLSVNAAHLQRIGAGGVFGVGHLWDGFQDLRELMRKWVTTRGTPWAALWAREYAGARHGQAGEHWHIALHLPERFRNDFAAQVSTWTGDDAGGDVSGCHTVARSAGRAWHLRSQAPHGNGPVGLASYLGKAEPSWRRRYGRTVPNTAKPCRRQNGGTGPIQGQRYGISRHIDDKAQAAAWL